MLELQSAAHSSDRQRELATRKRGPSQEKKKRTFTGANARWVCVTATSKNLSEVGKNNALRFVGKGMLHCDDCGARVSEETAKQHCSEKTHREEIGAVDQQSKAPRGEAKLHPLTTKTRRLVLVRVGSHASPSARTHPTSPHQAHTVHQGLIAFVNIENTY